MLGLAFDAVGARMSNDIVKSAMGAGVVAVIAATVLSDPQRAQSTMQMAQGLWGGAQPAARTPTGQPAKQPSQGRVALPPAAVATDPVKEQTSEPEAPIKQAELSRNVGYGVVELKADRVGQYHSDVVLEGMTYNMIVDTGATYVALSYDDAVRLNHIPLANDFKYSINTANGAVRAALVTLREVQIQTLMVRDVPAIVMARGVVSAPLLGMSFLKKFKVVADGGTMVLRE